MLCCPKCRAYLLQQWWSQPPFVTTTKSPPGHGRLPMLGVVVAAAKNIAIWNANMTMYKSLEPRARKGLSQLVFVLGSIVDTCRAFGRVWSNVQQFWQQPARSAVSQRDESWQPLSNGGRATS